MKMFPRATGNEWRSENKDRNWGQEGEDNGDSVLCFSSPSFGLFSDGGQDNTLI